MYIFCSKALADALNIKKNELQKMPVDRRRYHDGKNVDDS